MATISRAHASERWPSDGPLQYTAVDTAWHKVADPVSGDFPNIAAQGGGQQAEMLYCRSIGANGADGHSFNLAYNQTTTPTRYQQIDGGPGTDWLEIGPGIIYNVWIQLDNSADTVQLEVRY